MAQLRKQFEFFLTHKVGIDEDYFTDFEFRVGTTPLSNVYWPFLTILLYCIVIPSLQRFMKDRKPVQGLKWPLVIHNTFLSSISCFLCIFLLATTLSLRTSHSYTYHQVFCALNHNDQRGTLTLIFYVNYLLKYYELIDTIFLVLKKRDVSFLHGYHHPATLALTWGQLVDSTGVQGPIIFLNLWVHTVMYFYYFIMAAKLRFLQPKKWKQLVTIMQITQFIIGLSVVYYAVASNRLFGICSGTVRSAIVGCFILTSYLYLFVDYFAEVYKNKRVKNRLPSISVSLFVGFLSVFVFLTSTVIDSNNYHYFYQYYFY
eukprot:404261_1